jgi:hypothetical protein
MIMEMQGQLRAIVYQGNVYWEIGINTIRFIETTLLGMFDEVVVKVTDMDLTARLYWEGVGKSLVLEQPRNSETLGTEVYELRISPNAFSWT